MLVFTSVLCIAVAELALSRTSYLESQHDDLFQFDARVGWRWVPGRIGIINHRGLPKLGQCESAGLS